MKFAIIAAGEGSRLADEGITQPKPLVKICDVPLIDRLISIAEQNHAEEVSIIVNERMRDVREHLFNSQYNIPINIVVQSTPSSMHSLFVLAPYLHQSPFCLATVDSIFYAKEFQQYLAFAQAQRGSDGVLAVTDFIDDEKPLCVELDEKRRIIRFSDTKEQFRYATGGIYYFSPKIFDVMDAVLATGTLRLRNFLRYLIDHGYTLSAFPFAKIVDVDHASDIRIAEQFLAEEKLR
jgi:NDP-sugar pyrophosphorylase family protein